MEEKSSDKSDQTRHIKNVVRPSLLEPTRKTFSNLIGEGRSRLLTNEGLRYTDNDDNIFDNLRTQSNVAPTRKGRHFSSDPGSSAHKGRRNPVTDASMLPAHFIADAGSIRDAVFRPGVSPVVRRDVSDSTKPSGFSANRMKARNVTLPGLSSASGHCGESSTEEDLLASNAISKAKTMDATDRKLIPPAQRPPYAKLTSEIRKEYGWYCTSVAEVMGVITFTHHAITFEPDPRYQCVVLHGVPSFQVFIDMRDVLEVGAVCMPQEERGLDDTSLFETGCNRSPSAYHPHHTQTDEFDAECDATSKLSQMHDDGANHYIQMIVRTLDGRATADTSKEEIVQTNRCVVGTDTLPPVSSMTAEAISSSSTVKYHKRRGERGVKSFADGIFVDEVSSVQGGDDHGFVDESENDFLSDISTSHLRDDLPLPSEVLSIPKMKRKKQLKWSQITHVAKLLIKPVMKTTKFPSQSTLSDQASRPPQCCYTPSYPETQLSSLGKLAIHSEYAIGMNKGETSSPMPCSSFSVHDSVKRAHSYNYLLKVKGSSPVEANKNESLLYNPDLVNAAYTLDINHVSQFPLQRSSSEFLDNRHTNRKSETNSQYTSTTSAQEETAISEPSIFESGYISDKVSSTNLVIDNTDVLGRDVQGVRIMLPQHEDIEEESEQGKPVFSDATINVLFKLKEREIAREIVTMLSASIETSKKVQVPIGQSTFTSVPYDSNEFLKNLTSPRHIERAASLSRRVSSGSIPPCQETAPIEHPHHKNSVFASMPLFRLPLTGLLPSAVSAAVGLAGNEQALQSEVQTELCVASKSSRKHLMSTSHMLHNSAKEGGVCPAKLYVPIYKTLPRASDLMNDHIAAELASHLPPTLSCREWVLLFCSLLHGISFQTFYRLVCDRSPCIILVRDTCGAVFGVFTPVPLHQSGRYYGSGETFVFTFLPLDSQEPIINREIRVFRWSSNDPHILFTGGCSIAVGGGGGKYALTIDSSFFSGSSQPCATFRSPCLASSSDFSVAQFQVWSFE